MAIRILHVDDDPDLLELTSDFLARLGSFEVTGKTDAMSGLGLLASEPVDCIVSDYQMPGLDGLEFLARVRERDVRVPFVLFTGRGSEEVASDAFAAGATDYLQKRTGSEQYEMLAKRVRNAVASRRAEVRADRSRRFLEKIVERATDMIAVVDSGGELVFVSGSVSRVLGYTPEEVREMGPFELLHPEDREAVREQFASRLTDPDSPTGISHRVVRRDGSTVRVFARAYNLVDDPDVEGILIYTAERDWPRMTVT